MTKRLYSIRDSKGEIFYPPFPALTHGEAERNFREIANDPKTQIAKYPEDYDLYYLGTFDDASGKVETSPSPEHMMKAIQAVRPPSRSPWPPPELASNLDQDNSIKQ